MWILLREWLVAGQKKLKIFRVAYYLGALSLLQNCIRNHLPCAKNAARYVYVYNTNAPLAAQAPQALIVYLPRY